MTAVMHEFGHVLGFEHDDEGFMQEMLPQGTRRLWDAVESAFADESDVWNLD